MLATIASAALQGIDAEAVHVEVNAGEAGEPKWFLVGLPDTAVKESCDRVFAALNNSGFHPPRTRTTINLAPGNVRKEGPCYDLPIALGILAATGQLKAENLGDWMIAGELSLSGATLPVRGALAMTRLARTLRKRGVLMPAISAEEAALVEGMPVYRVDSLDGAVRFLRGEAQLKPLDAADSRRARQAPSTDGAADFSEIKGQHALRRAVEIAVSGNHNLLRASSISEFGRRLLLGGLLTLGITTPVLAADGPYQPSRVDVYFSPDGGATDACVKEITAAKKSVHVQAYSFTSPPIAKALVEAKKRGVQVTAILDKSQRTEKYSEADFLAHGGIPTLIDSRHAIAHNKIIVIDGEIVITGSFNFTRAAEERNAENMLVIRDPKLAARYLRNWQEHRAHSEPYSGR